MVHADGGVVALSRTGAEQGIGRHRAEGVDAPFAERRHRRRDDVGLLRAHGPVLAGVGIESGHRQPRPGDAEVAAQRRLRYGRRLDDAFGIQRPHRVAQARMSGHRHRPQLRTRQHHDRGGAAPGKGSQELRVAGKREPGLVQAVFLDGVGDHGRGVPGADKGHGAFDGGANGFGVGRVRMSGHRLRGQRLRQHGKARGKGRRRAFGCFDRRDGHGQVKTPGQPPEPLGIVDGEETGQALVAAQPGLEGNFSTHARRFAHGQGQRFFVARGRRDDHFLTSTNAARLRSRRYRRAAMFRR